MSAEYPIQNVYTSLNCQFAENETIVILTLQANNTNRPDLDPLHEYGPLTTQTYDNQTFELLKEEWIYRDQSFSTPTNTEAEVFGIWENWVAPGEPPYPGDPWPRDF